MISLDSKNCCNVVTTDATLEPRNDLQSKHTKRCRKAKHATNTVVKRSPSNNIYLFSLCSFPSDLEKSHKLVSWENFLIIMPRKILAALGRLLWNRKSGSPTFSVLKWLVNNELKGSSSTALKFKEDLGYTETHWMEVKRDSMKHQNNYGFNSLSKIRKWYSC